MMVSSRSPTKYILNCNIITGSDLVDDVEAHAATALVHVGVKDAVAEADAGRLVGVLCSSSCIMGKQITMIAIITHDDGDNDNAAADDDDDVMMM
jgi:hypothetical protein